MLDREITLIGAMQPLYVYDSLQTQRERVQTYRPLRSAKHRIVRKLTKLFSKKH